MAPSSPRLSHTAALILKTLSVGYRYGFDVMDATGLASGTVYPALKRMERDGLIVGAWESDRIAASEERPPRRYYRLTPIGKTALTEGERKYPLIASFVPAGVKQA